MDTTITVAIIGGVALVLAAMMATLTPILVKLLRGMRRIRVQVENNHTTNMREEGDARHEVVDGKLDRIMDAVQNVSERLTALEGRTDDLEDTIETHHPKQRASSPRREWRARGGRPVQVIDTPGWMPR